MKQKAVILTGSVRPGNMTRIAALQIKKNLEERGVSVHLLDPSGLNLTQPGIVPQQTDTELLKKAVAEADMVVLATPEYNGSFSSVIKLMIENLTGPPHGLAGKPVALLGVASGVLGAVKSLEMLRSVMGHVGAFLLPRPLSISEVDSRFDADGNCTDPETADRIARLAEDLIVFAQRFSV